jgi:NAD(P)-dependent dehydrogenase (short-subunit alcohol dehydrogenase family)
MSSNYPRMSGKTCLITGATSGIGKVTALELAKQGASVVIVARSAEKGEATRKELQAASDNAAVDLLLADLSSQASIQQLATAFKDRYEHLHVLINNAGVTLFRRETTVDGLEMTFAVNNLAPLLLNHLLLAPLKASGSARIINVDSDAHVSARINLADLQLEQGYNFWRAYGQSKLALLLCTYVMAAQLDGSGITVNAVHPGFVGTNIGMNNVSSRWRPLARKTIALLGTSPEKGASTTLYLAMSPEVEHVTGKYFVRCVPKKSSPLSYDQALQQQVWEKSLQLIHVSADVVSQASA